MPPEIRKFSQEELAEMLTGREKTLADYAREIATELENGALMVGYPTDLTEPVEHPSWKPEIQKPYGALFTTIHKVFKGEGKVRSGIRYLIDPETKEGRYWILFSTKPIPKEKSIGDNDQRVKIFGQ